MSDLLNRMNNAVTRANLAANTAFNILTGAAGTTVTVQGEDVPTLATRIREYVEEVVGDGSLDGADGIGIEELYVDENGHLMVRLGGELDPSDLGQVRPEDGDGIQDIEYDVETGELTITLTTDDVISLGKISGDDAPTIADAYISESNLVIEVSDGTVFDAGDISRFGGVTVNYVDLSESGDLLVILSDGNITNLGYVLGERGKVGRSIISGYVDAAGNLVFLRNDGEQINVGQVSVKIPDENSVVVEGAKLGGADGKELILTLSTGDINVGRVVGADGLAGDDGKGIKSITLNLEGMLEFTMSDDSVESVGPILNIDTTEGSIFLTNAVVDENDELNLTVNDNGDIKTINVGNVKGADGTDGQVVESAAVDPETGELKFYGVGEVELFSAGVIEQNSVKEATINEEGHLILELTDGTTIDSGADIRGVAGIDGIGVTGSYIDENGHLWFTFDEMEDADVGKVTAPVETNVELVDKQIIITLSDGQEFGPFDISGADGQYMTAAKIVEGELIVTLSQDGDVNLGSIEKNPNELSFNEEGGFKLTFSDNTFIETLERVQGIDGNTVESVEIDVDTKELVLTVTTENGANTQEVRVPNTVGKSITDVQVEGDDLLIFVDESEDPVRATIPKGIDGNTITDISFDGNDLSITTSDAPEVPVVIPSVQGDTVESVTVEGDELVFKVSPQEEEIRFPTIKGIDAVESVKNVTFNKENGSLIISMVDESEIIIENARGIDGITIDRIYIGLDSELIIETSDGGLYQFPYLEGRDGDTIMDVSINEDLNLEINYKIEGVEDKVIIEAVHGRDGFDAATIKSVEVNEEKQLIIEMSDEETTYTVDGVGASVSGIEVDQETGLLTISLDDGSEFTSTESIRGRDGFGTGVKNVQYNEEGRLIVTLSDIKGEESTEDAGKVEVVHITNATTVEGDLVFDFSDGREPVNVGRIMGKDGRHVESATIDEETKHLILSMSDGSEVDAGNSRGEDGRSVVNVEVIATNEIVVEYDDDTVQVVGNIGGSDDLTLWESNIPYAKDRVVIHEGTLYLSMVDRNSAKPPHANWRAIAFGDYLVEIRKPVCISPIDGESGNSIRPQLVMSPYAPLVSVDELDYREIQVYLSTPSTLAYTANHNEFNQNVHEVETDLIRERTYKWRFRDITVNGSISEWSEEQTFTTPALQLEDPTININEYENVNAAFAAPKFETSAFDVESGQNHVSTDWEVRLVEDDSTVYESLTNTEDKITHVIPFGNLEEGTTYKVRAKQNGNSISTGWSDWLEFTTEAVFDYIETPKVIYLGDDPQVIESFPEFAGTKFRKTERFLGVSENVSMGLVSTEWQIVNADTGEDYEVVNKDTSMLSLKAKIQWMNETNYRVRVKYKSDRFGSSEMSPWFEGKSVVNVTTPVLTTLEDVLNFPATGIISGGEFIAVNETHVSTDWELRDSLTDEVVWSRIGNKTDLTEILVKIPFGYKDNDLKFRVKYNAVNVESEWSAYMDLHAIDHFSGAGSEVLVGGDNSAGFFGEVPVGDLFSGTELSGLIGLSAGTNINPNEPWLKFILDGEIIYVAKKPYKHSVSWDSINAAKAVYDNETSKIVSKDGNDYRVTLMRGANKDPSGASGPHDLSEWDRLMYKIHVDDPNGEPWAEYTNNDLTFTSGNGRAMWCQESSGSSRIARGFSSLVSFSVYAPSISSPILGWRPTLRLI